MLPSQDEFIYHMQNLDIRLNDTIVCYDKTGMLTAPRAFFMFKLFGAPNVKILNGTFSKWKAEGRPIESSEGREAFHRARSTKAGEKDYEYIIDQQKVISYEQVN